MLEVKESIQYSITEDKNADCYNQEFVISTDKRVIVENTTPFIYKNGKNFKDSKGWRFSCYRLEELIEAALSPLLEKKKILKNGEMNIPFGMRYIRELDNSTTSPIEQKKIIDDFVTSVCKSKICTNRNSKYLTLKWDNNNETTYISTDWYKHSKFYQVNNQSSDINWRNSASFAKQ